MALTMKNLRSLAFFSILTLGLLSSCFEDREVLFLGAQVEFEQAVTNAKAAGQSFPLLTALTRASGTPSYQVNLVGAQLSAAEAITVTRDEVPASLLNANTIVAEEGVHYTLNGNLDFPASASKVNFTGLTILPGFPAQTGKTALIILKLDGNSNLKPSENYRRLGIRINLN